MSFKVGDKVKVVRVRAGLPADVGATGVVIAVNPSGSVVEILWDAGIGSGSYYADQFELVKPKVDYMQITRDMVGGRR